jgi:argininosuccinate lyase
MKKKLWAGRFDKAMAKEVERFTASISFDKRLFRYDIEGSLAHVAMLARSGLISKADATALRRGLKKVRDELANGTYKPDAGYEDIHMAVESRLKKHVGPVADKLHTARSRNDQVALDTRLFVRGEIGEIDGGINALQRAIVRCAWRYRDLVMPGFTHLQHAQPVLFAHHCLAYVEMLQRDRERLSDCYRRADCMPLGAGALAGSTLPIDRRYVAGLLGFKTVSRNSIDAVSDRDFIVEFLAAIALIGIHLSRMAEEIVLWVSREFSYMEIDLSYLSGSSLMPQKANPDVAELVRGKSGRLMGDLVALLTVLKGVPLAYNRDFQEDKEPLFDAVDTVRGCLAIMAGLWGRIGMRRNVVEKALWGDYSQATDLAEYLVARGCPFRKAHEIVGKLVKRCIRERMALEEITLDVLRAASDKFDSDALSILQHHTGVKRKRSLGSTSPREVMKELRSWRKKLGLVTA